MPSNAQFEALREALTPNSLILSEYKFPDFQDYLSRWSDIGKETPDAIIVPGSEEDCEKVVQWAVTNDVPFVCKAGGMSLYSTIGDGGIVIDLDRLSSVSHQRESHEAILNGAVSTKTVAVELGKDGFCTTLPSANPVGAIPFFLNGGNSPLVSKLGYGTDNILSARIITASGKPVTVSENENSDLLYAIRGAGQYFGVVVSLTIRTYPVSEIFGNEQGSFWTGRFVFSLDRAEAVSKVMEQIVNNKSYCTGGLIAIAAPPPTYKPAVAVIARLIGERSEELQETAFKALYDLMPIMSGGALTRNENIGDALRPLCVHGDYKKLRLTGIQSYNSKFLPELTTLWQELVSTCPDSRPSMFAIQWDSHPPVSPRFDSANAMHDMCLWANNLIWAENAGGEIAQGFLERAISITRQDQKLSDYVDFANSVREPESPIQLRYRGQKRLDKLRGLKAEWDPDGIFGRELL